MKMVHSLRSLFLFLSAPLLLLSRYASVCYLILFISLSIGKHSVVSRLPSAIDKNTSALMKPVFLCLGHH